MVYYKNVSDGFVTAIYGTISLKSAQLKWRDKLA